MKILKRIKHSLLNFNILLISFAPTFPYYSLHFHNFCLAYKICFGNTGLADGIKATCYLRKVSITTALQNSCCHHTPVTACTVQKKMFVGVYVFYPVVDVCQWPVVSIFHMGCCILSFFAYVYNFIFTNCYQPGKLFCVNPVYNICFFTCCQPSGKTSL